MYSRASRFDYRENEENASVSSKTTSFVNANDHWVPRANRVVSVLFLVDCLFIIVCESCEQTWLRVGGFLYRAVLYFNRGSFYSTNLEINFINLGVLSIDFMFHCDMKMVSNL